MSAADDTDISLQIKRLELSQTRCHEVFITIRTVVICFTVLVCMGAICYSIIRISEKPWWVTLLLAIFGPAGLVSVLLPILLLRTNKAVKRLHDYVKEQDENNNHLPTGH
jgi:hypothetical protein